MPEYSVRTRTVPGRRTGASSSTRLTLRGPVKLTATGRRSTTGTVRPRGRSDGVAGVAVDGADGSAVGPAPAGGAIDVVTDDLLPDRFGRIHVISARSNVTLQLILASLCLRNAHNRDVTQSTP